MIHASELLDLDEDSIEEIDEEAIQNTIVFKAPPTETE